MDSSAKEALGGLLPEMGPPRRACTGQNLVEATDGGLRAPVGLGLSRALAFAVLGRGRGIGRFNLEIFQHALSTRLERVVELALGRSPRLAQNRA
jgi:hypothetical protein